MSFLELSVFDLVFTSTVIIIVVFFIFLLLKLNPSTENDQIHGEKVLDRESEATLALQAQRQIHLQQATRQGSSPADLRNRQDIGLQKLQQPHHEILVNAAEGSETEENVESIVSRSRTPRVQDTLEPNEASNVPKRTSENFGNSNGKECIHEFGYLKALPKNRPIPDECFGCQKIVDCIRNKKKS